MILSDIPNFVGRFHPMIVHLPIGIFILAFFFDLISYHKKFSHSRQLVPLIIFTGFIFSILAVILGYFLSFGDEYDRNTLSNHKVAGITLTLLTGLLYLLQLRWFKKWITVPPVLNTVFMTLMIVFLMYTGHQGANLTHGSDYINLSMLNEKKREQPQNASEALLYEDVVQPILSRKCVQCHRQGKKKGRLSLESIAEMKKGGKSGPGIIEGNSAESEVIQRILLDPSHEDFMPSDGKTPLTKNETSILKWWVEKGMTSGGNKMSQLKDAAEITAAVSSFLQVKNDNNGNAFPDQQIDKEIPDSVNMKAIENLREKGINVRIMFHRPVMLDVTLPPGSKDKLISASGDLNDVALNIIWLNLSGSRLTVNELKFLPSMKNLVKLRLEKNDISNDICSLLTPLTKLEAVNLNETLITHECIDALTRMPAMKNVYSWSSTERKEKKITLPK